MMYMKILQWLILYSLSSYDKFSTFFWEQVMRKVILMNEAYIPSGILGRLVATSANKFFCFLLLIIK